MSELDVDLSALERYRPIVDDWEAFAACLQRPLPVCGWANELKASPEEVVQRIARRHDAPQRLPWAPQAFELPESASTGNQIEYLTGMMHIQEEVSIIPTMLLDPQPGERILDLCAAPGNKTAQIAVAMENTGTVVANDRSPGRQFALYDTANRLGLVNVAATVHDAASFPLGAGLFDRVLADVPCSCEGTSRKHPSVLEEVAESDPGELAGLQTAILRRAVTLCRPGGRIVYSTCTYAPEENECVVDAVLREFGEALEVVPGAIAGLTHDPGLTRWRGRDLDARLEQTMRFYPHHNDAGGFYCAILEKRTPTAEEATPDPELLSPIDEAAYFELLADRFGIGREALSGYGLVDEKSRYVSLVSADLQAPAVPEPRHVGLKLLRTNMRFPKPTTDALRLLAPHLTRNVVALSPEQMERFIARETCLLNAEQRSALTGRGYVLCTHDDLPLGVGDYYPKEGRLRSLLPKSRSRTPVW